MNLVGIQIALKCDFNQLNYCTVSSYQLMLSFQCDDQQHFEKQLIYQNWLYPRRQDYVHSYMYLVYDESILNMLNRPYKRHFTEYQEYTLTYEPQLSKYRQCVAEIFPGAEDFQRKWIMVPCNKTYTTLIICERKRNINDGIALTRGYLRDKLKQNIQLQGNRFFIADYFCLHGWFYQNRCYNLAAWKYQHNVQCKEQLQINPNHLLFHLMLPLRKSLERMADQLYYCVNYAQKLAMDTVPGLHRCLDGTYIAEHHMCDGTADCPDASDESSCIHVCSFLNKSHTDCYSMCHAEYCVCHPLYFQCASGGCIALSKFCNSIVDCADDSDEAQCKSEETGNSISYDTNDVYACLSGDIISITLLNDTVPDCPEYGDDEAWLSNDINSIETSEDPIMLACIPGHPKLYSHHYACTLVWKANGHIAPCRNGGHLRHCIHHSCPHQYKCPFSYCIPTQAVCDGRVDCTDGSDEENCINISCPNLLKCKQEATCIHFIDINNGVADCTTSRDDEVMGISVCPDSCECKGTAVFCHSLPQDQKHIRAVVTALVILSSDVLIVTDQTNVDKYKALQYLDISHNRFENTKQLKIANLPSLIKLFIYNVTMKEIPTMYFDGMLRLVELQLGLNDVVSIQVHAFAELHSLTNLDLSQQMLSHIADCAFHNLASLQYLNLSYNKLSQLTAFICGENALEIFDIIGNDILHLEQNFFSALQYLHTLYSNVDGICCYGNLKICVPKSTDEFASCENITSNKVIEYTAWLFGILILLENISAFVFHHTSKGVTTKQFIHKLFATSLNVSDLLMGIYITVLALFNLLYAGDFTMIHHVWKGSIQCKILAFVSYGSLQMSLLMTVVLCIERFLGVCFPMSTLR